MTTHTAWTFFAGDKIAYVAEVNRSGRGDRYSYTDKEEKAAKLTEEECRAFCEYAKECQRAGFWS